MPFCTYLVVTRGMFPRLNPPPPPPRFPFAPIPPPPPRRRQKNPPPPPACPHAWLARPGLGHVLLGGADLVLGGLRQLLLWRTPSPGRRAGGRRGGEGGEGGGGRGRGPQREWEGHGVRSGRLGQGGGGRPFLASLLWGSRNKKPVWLPI